MKNDGTGKSKNEVRAERKTERSTEQRVELKYCEGCGGLGIRECGGGRVYCDDCTRKLAELAVSKTASRRPTLPVGKHSVLNDCADSRDADSRQLDSDPDHADSNDLDSNDLDSSGKDSDDLDAMACFPTRLSAGGVA
jgi:hypothetical protein